MDGRRVGVMPYCIPLVLMSVKIVFICPARVHVKLIINSFGINLTIVNSLLIQPFGATKMVALFL